MTPGPRACVYASKRLNALRLGEFCTRDLTAVLIESKMGGNTEKIVVCSAYLPYDSEEPPPTRELRVLMEACKNRGLQLVVGCDANAHHIIWGSTDINRRGTSLLEYLSTTELEILNRGSKPTFVTTRRQEVIDITLGSKKVAQAIKDWQVAEEVTLSDHRLIEFKLAGDANREPTEVYRNPRATDWQLYKEGLERRLGGGGGLRTPENGWGDRAGG